MRAIPGRLARRIGPCRVSLLPRFRSRRTASRWTESDAGIRIELAVDGREPHDVGMELLLCTGQALWERASAEERGAFLALLRAEIEAGVAGEIDDDVLALKSAVLGGKRGALKPFCRAAFAASCAEFVHALWHDVTVRTGPLDLPPDRLRARLELFAAWFPPDRGYRLFPEGGARP